MKNNWKPKTITTGTGYYIHSTHPEAYRAWTGMISRCYNPETLKLSPTYKGCSVDLEWHNFQNFARWYETKCKICNNGYIYQLDKDLKTPLNKIYSSDTCLLVPRSVNLLFPKMAAQKAKQYWKLKFYKVLLKAIEYPELSEEILNYFIWFEDRYKDDIVLDRNTKKKFNFVFVSISDI